MAPKRLFPCLMLLTLNACFDPAPDVGVSDDDSTLDTTGAAADESASGSSVSSGDGDAATGSGAWESGSEREGTGTSTSTGGPDPVETGGSSEGGESEDSTTSRGDSTGVADTSRVVFLLVNNGAPMDFGGLDGADQRCQDNADSAGLDGTFMAWLSAGSTAQVLDRFSVDGGPFVLPDGTSIATDWADLTDGSLAAPILVDAAGAVYDAGAQPERQVITHTNPDGTSAPGISPCAGFNGDSAVEAGWGNASTIDTSWSSTGDRWRCDSDAGGGPSLYCFQQ